MIYPKISALVPQDEHFDEGGIVNEGGFLSTAHLAAIEAELSVDPSADNTAALEQANASIEDLTTERNALQGQVDASQTTITEKDARITELEAQVVELGKSSSGDGTVVTTTVDDVVVSATGKGLLDPSHPLNVAASKTRKKA
jgi:hypothetical protein